MIDLAGFLGSGMLVVGGLQKIEFIFPVFPSAFARQVKIRKITEQSTCWVEAGLIEQKFDNGQITPANCREHWGVVSRLLTRNRVRIGVRKSHAQHERQYLVMAALGGRNHGLWISLLSNIENGGNPFHVSLCSKRLKVLRAGLGPQQIVSSGFASPGPPFCRGIE